MMSAAENNSDVSAGGQRPILGASGPSVSWQFVGFHCNGARDVIHGFRNPPFDFLFLFLFLFFVFEVPLLGILCCDLRTSKRWLEFE
jgi:hypothetical protein